METTGERIKRYREALGLTQEELAIKINTSPQNIYKYEKGIIRNIPLDKIKVLSGIFDITPAQLVGWGADPYADFRRSSTPDPFNEIGELSDIEKSIISAYRKNPDCHVAVQRILGVEQPAVKSMPHSTDLKLASPMPPYEFRKDKTDEK